MATTPTTCPTCGQAANQPYRRRNPRTHEIVEGCVSAYHDGAVLMPTDQAWHSRKEAVAIRRRTRRVLPGVAF